VSGGANSSFDTMMVGDVSSSGASGERGGRSGLARPRPGGGATGRPSASIVPQVAHS
jgi:hypothetical protein